MNTMNPNKWVQYNNHVVRSFQQKFKPLTPAQYESLCNKIEQDGK